MSEQIKLSVSIVIPNYNGQHLLVDTITCAYNALDTSGIIDYEIIVSDDASTDDSFHHVTNAFPEIVYVKNEGNTGFAGNMNRGILRATKELVCFLNSDVHLSSGYFSSQLPLFQDEQTFGVMGAIFDKETNEPQDGAKSPRIGLLKIESNKNIFSSTEVLPTLFLSGANALVRRKELLELGGFCELFNPYYSEDVDLGLRAWRNGWSLYFQPMATLPVALTLPVTARLPVMLVLAMMLTVPVPLGSISMLLLLTVVDIVPPCSCRSSICSLE